MSRSTKSPDRRMGVNISDRYQPFTDQILAGRKVIETRPTDSLKPWIGVRVGIIRTVPRRRAMLVGLATIGEPIRYLTVEQFRADEALHCVAAGSEYDWAPGGKYGYPLLDVAACDPVPIFSLGIVARRIDDEVWDTVAGCLKRPTAVGYKGSANFPAPQRVWSK